MPGGPTTSICDEHCFAMQSFLCRKPGGEFRFRKNAFGLRHPFLAKNKCRHHHEIPARIIGESVNHLSSYLVTPGTV